MRKWNIARMIAGLLSGMSLMLSAQVKMVDTPLPPDGNFTGSGWQDIPEQGNFVCLKRSGKQKPESDTSFKVAADADNLYMSILCRESKMDKLQRSPDVSRLWTSDDVEIFFAPTGLSDEFYQFVVSAGNVRYSMYYGESGVIHPDPYKPFWDSRVFYGKDYWLVQLRIPFSAFYMTRNAKWNTEWLLNVSRTRTAVKELSSWSPLEDGFHESKNYRKFKGFPQRNPVQDIFISDVTPDVQNFEKGVYSGPLHLNIEANPAAAGRYELCVEEPNGKSSKHAVTLKSGLNRITLSNVEYLKKKQGKTDLKLNLTGVSGKPALGRSYPVDIIYQPVQIELTSPGYKRNFYPGQDFSAIRGNLKFRLSAAQKKSAKVELAISGGGLAEKKMTFKADKEVVPFSFDSIKLTEGGTALLTAKLTDGGKVIASLTCPVSRLKKNPSMVWIENGMLVKNGKPWYPRYIYARGYRGGTVFAKRYESDDLAESQFKSASLEPNRLIRGIEGKEATKDIKPSPELFAKVRKVVEEKRSDPDFDFYYISDEPECRSVSPVYLKYIYDFVNELDPYHPLVTCSRSADRYMDCADIFSTHPYISPMVSNGKRIYGTPMHLVRKHLQDVIKFNRPDKVVGFTGQFFSYKFGNILADYPTWEEIECMSWSAIVHGSRFHFPYAYHDLGDRPQIYEGYRYMNQSIRALEKILFSGRKCPVKTVDPENMIDTLLIVKDNTVLLIVVNLKNGPLKTEVYAEALKEYQSLFEFRGKEFRNLSGGKLKLSLKPYECVILSSMRLDAGLKTRDQVVKEVAQAEKARGERGNLLFEKGTAFEVDSSNPGNTLGQRNKLFDGTLDMLAWDSKAWSKENWYELHFRKNPPKFSKIAIHGYNFGNPTVKVWKFGEWKNLDPKKIVKGENSVTLDFGEEWKSVKVHIDFPGKIHGKAVELYEIELLK